MAKTPRHNTTPRHALLEALRDCAVPWARAKTLQVVLAQPPLCVPEGGSVAPVAVPLLQSKPQRDMKQQSLPPFLAASWPEHGLAANPYVSLCCVLEGTADLRIGVTEAMAAANPHVDRRYGRYSLRLPARSLCIFPPRVPYSDGNGPHWEMDFGAGGTGEEPFSRLLWINVLPEGLFAHICTTAGADHSAGPRLFVIDTIFQNTTRVLLDYLGKAREPGNRNCSSEITTLYLLILFLHAEANLTAHNYTTDVEPHQAGEALRESKAPLAASARVASEQDSMGAVQRACDFIETHLTEPIAAEHVASHAYVSISHLNRLFQAAFNSSVMNYVAGRRIEMAVSLLGNTNLTISAIGHHLGYRHATHFSRVFARHVGLSPVQYRQNLKIPSEIQTP